MQSKSQPDGYVALTHHNPRCIDDAFDTPSTMTCELRSHAPLVPVKDTNPKDLIGSTKLPLNLVPSTLQVFAAASFAEGASKYGAFNWRIAGVRASIYVAALQRHLVKWFNGEECDPKTKVPHLASVIACAGIILDARACGKLTDDRPPSVDMEKLIAELEGVVQHVYGLHAHMQPHHNTIADGEKL